MSVAMITMAYYNKGGILDGVLLALALFVVFWPSGVMAGACPDKATDLTAAKTIDAGNINDAATLTVTYEATYPWCLLETHLHVATNESDIPQTKKGNAKPGQFEYGDDYGGCHGGPATFEIDLAEIGADIGDGVSPGDTVVIAAQAEVDNGARRGRLGQRPPLRRARQLGDVLYLHGAGGSAVRGGDVQVRLRDEQDLHRQPGRGGGNADG
jgi:hypothetical protein